MTRRLLSYFFLLLSTAVFVQCARRGRPTGGERDKTPPVLVKATPENKSTRFSGNTFTLKFDEYVQLKEAEKQLVVSPPLKYPLELKPKLAANKTVEVTILDTLNPNTTYAFNFGQSIVDYNEGNPYDFFRYIFSTGEFIDSLTMRGVVSDAFNKDPDTYISIMLYRKDTAYTDSTIYKKLPNYITNTLDSIVVFTLENLNEDTYEIVALKDENNNNMFDPMLDKIGFLNRDVTVPLDSFVSLSTFKEIPDFRLMRPKLETNNRISFGYFGELQNLKFEYLTPLPEEAEIRFLKERETDTLNFWFKSMKMDSIVFKITEPTTQNIDTFTVKMRKLPSDSLVFKRGTSSNKPFSWPFHLEANIPLSKLDPSKILIVDKDTVLVPFQGSIEDSLNRVRIDFEKTEKNLYNIQIFPGAITDFYEHTNDTLSYTLSTKALESLGILKLKIEQQNNSPIIVELLDQKMEVQRVKMGNKNTEFTFEYLTPDLYWIRITEDKNNNQKWDTGSYLKKIQPEKVFYYPDQIDVRSNWEIEQKVTVPF